MSLNKVNYVHGQTIISAQNMNDIQDEIIRLGEKETVQSDWLETNEDSLAYVKNRTHWIDWQESELFNGVFEEDEEDGTWVVFIENAKTPILKANNKYQVTIEEESFESTLVDITEFVDEGINKAYALGNLSVIDPDLFLNNEEPFLLGMLETTDGIIGMLMIFENIPREAEGYRVRISGQSGSVNKLDEIYMPESYNELAISFPNLNERLNSAESTLNNQFYKLVSLENTLSETIKHTTQNLTEAQKARARKNIGAIGIDEGIQADLSETDESSLAFVKGVLRRDSIPGYIPRLAEIVPQTGNKVECLCEQWILTTMFGNTAMGSFLQIENIDQLQTMNAQNLCIQFNNNPGLYYPLYHSDDLDGNYWINEDRTIMLLNSVDIYMIVVFGEEQPSFSSIMLAEVNWSHSKQLQRLHPALLPYDAVRRSELDKLNLITLEDIDMICAKTVKVTFPQHSLAVKISYTDSKGVFHENEDLPGKSKTTYEVIKDTPIKLNGNYFDYSTFVLPQNSKYYTRISNSEIIPHRNFEIKYADGAPT